MSPAVFAQGAFHLDADWTVTNLPPGISITLESAKPVWHLGENVLLYYRVQNNGPNAFRISTGGDYRGSRAMRIKVSATDSDGRALDDPEPEQMNFGGLMGNGEIPPGKSRYVNVYVQEYRRFDKPGVYTIQVYHDLGAGEKIERDPREVFVTIKLEATTEQDARDILAAEENAPKDFGNVDGEKGAVHLDYYRIRNPAFLPALVERTVTTNQNALVGISSIPTPAATKALVGLLKHTNAAFATAAFAFVENRLPHPTNDFGTPWQSNFLKQRLVTNAWDDALAPEVNQFAVALLAKKDRADFLTAARILRCIGTSRELPPLMAALDHAMAHLDDDFSSDLGYPRPESACDRLAEAASMIDPKGNALPKDIDTPAHALLFLLRHQPENAPERKAYDDARGKLLDHALAYLRAETLNTLATNVPASLADLVTKRMNDPDPSVRAYAFQAARSMNDPRHKDIALEALRTSNDRWVRDSASDIALKQGTRYECAMAWTAQLAATTDRTPGASTLFDALSHLSSICQHPDGRGGGGSGGSPNNLNYEGLRQRWRDFLTTHKDQINAGQAFKYGDGEMPADLLPPTFEFH